MADLSILATLAATPPAWLDRSFFEKVVRHMENDPQAQLQDFNLDAGSRFGDNFSSSVFRVSVTFTSKFAKEPKTISTIVKVELQFPPELSHLVKKQYFRNEVEMYGKVLPEIQSLWLSADDKEILAPKWVLTAILIRRVTWFILLFQIDLSVQRTAAGDCFGGRFGWRFFTAQKSARRFWSLEENRAKVGKVSRFNFLPRQWKGFCMAFFS